MPHPEINPADYTPGTIIHNHPDHLYRWAPGLSSTEVKTFCKQSPKHFQLKHVTRQLHSETTQNMLLGTLVHCLVLEPREFKRRFEQELDPEDYPDALVTADDLKKYCKEQELKLTGLKGELIKRVREHNPEVPIWDDMLKNQRNSKKTLISKALWQKTHALCDGVMANDEAARILFQGQAEVSVWGELTLQPDNEDEEITLLTKCRPDWLSHNGLCVDLKTCSCSSPSEFARDVAKFGYDLQQVHYMETLKAAGVACDTFVFIAVESDPPYLCQVYTVSERDIEVARERYFKLLKQIHHCREADTWPGYADPVSDLELPRWHLNQMRAGV